MVWLWVNVTQPAVVCWFPLSRQSDPLTMVSRSCSTVWRSDLRSLNPNSHQPPRNLLLSDHMTQLNAILFINSLQETNNKKLLFCSAPFNATRHIYCSAFPFLTNQEKTWVWRTIKTRDSSILFSGSPCWDLFFVIAVKDKCCSSCNTGCEKSGSKTSNLFWRVAHFETSVVKSWGDGKSLFPRHSAWHQL